MLEISGDTVLERQSEEDAHEQDEGEQLEGKSMEEIEVIKGVKETEKNKRDLEIDKSIATFLRDKGLSENLVKTLINAGLTDEHVRLLKALNLNDDDINNLRYLWRAKIEISKSNDSFNSSTSDSSSDDVHLSSNNVYLKKVLSKPLIRALCEIVAKKPADPVEYLGHWLFHFKVCEERIMQQKERDLELLIDREKLRLKKVEDEQNVSIEEKKEDISGEDGNYINIYNDTLNIYEDTN